LTTIDDIAAIQADFASRGQRVLLLAKNIIPSASLDKGLFSDPTLLKDHLISLNSDLVIVGLIALVDPPRHDTSETVRVCRRAGIRFVMVTGNTLQQFMMRCDI
jgi:Cation transport ATPase